MILVLGDAMLDQDVNYVTRRMSNDNTPIVELVETAERFGGAAAVAAMVKGLGGICYTHFGDKPPSVKIRHRIDGREVFRCDKDNLDFVPESIQQSIVDMVANVPSDGIILLADYGKNFWSRELWDSIVSAAKARILVDPARNRNLENYRGAWGICPNRLEWNGNSPKLAEFNVCYKLDKDGMVVYERGILTNKFSSNAQQPIIDSCGAGDMVLAALGVGLVTGMNWTTVCEFANYCAGIKCGMVGAVPITI